MRSGLRVLLGLTTAAALGLGLPAAASASASVPASVSTSGAAAGTATAAERWEWGPTASTDFKGWASGEIRTTRSGLRISGDVYDGGGARTCTWLKIKWLTDRGKWRTATYKNCSQSRTRSFRINAGYMLTSSAKVCRGTSARVTGKCSHWEGVWSQGG
ncbi:hypothetical protein Skr01_20320 [Sphaerisporangium krabiense]|uniref:Uncharacterized protein n=1 Tax=Sphaerisporangium krabiense TaxID=763782 RepID=A0A7W9DQV6_9ACTN|nr:hypothetical protein [Sphaerisporangium krabiense]MBB5627788.1 hypothetical protein [Sphaerisporangium krabiense]GII61947.1 hypothetical protein Skr01_20320 [Sphaerisporangium krabiense]